MTNMNRTCSQPRNSHRGPHTARRNNGYQNRDFPYSQSPSRAPPMLPPVTTLSPVLTLPTLSTPPTMPNLPTLPSALNPLSPPFHPRNPNGPNSTYIEFTLRPRSLVGPASPTYQRSQSPRPPPTGPYRDRERSLPPNHPDAEYRPPQSPYPPPAAVVRHYTLRSNTPTSTPPSRASTPQNLNGSNYADAVTTAQTTPQTSPAPPPPRRYSSNVKTPPLPPRKPAILRRPRQELEDGDEDVKFTKDDIIIAVMGVTGSGKSTFISLLSNQEIEIGHGLQSCTTKVGVYHFTYKGVRIFLVDTPGFDDTTRSDAEVLKDVAFWLASAYTQETHLAGILYLHRISDPRMGGAALRNLRMFTQLCGEENLGSVVLATTHWANKETGISVSEETGEKRVRELCETEGFWGGMIERGSRVVRHDGSWESALKIVEEIVEKKIKVILDIQRQMVDEERSLDDTDAAVALQTELIAERKKFEEKLGDLKLDMEFAIKEKDEKWQKQIKDEQDRYAEEIKKTHEETEALRMNLKEIAMEKEEEFRKMREEMERQAMKYEEQIKETSRALDLAREEQKRKAEEHEVQRRLDDERAERMAEMHRREMEEMEERIREEGNKVLAERMEREREESEMRFQQARDEAAVKAKLEQERWEQQQKEHKENQQALIQQRDEADRRFQDIAKEQKKSKDLFLSAIDAILTAGSALLAIYGVRLPLGH